MDQLQLFLKEEFARRCKANSGYSLRAFARTLKIEPSALSKILNGKRRISSKKFEGFVQPLRLSPQQIELLAPPEKLRRKGHISKDIEYRYREVPLDDSIDIESHWYYFAILELTYLSTFKPDFNWIAKTIGISRAEAKLAVEKLTRHKFLEISPQGVWKDISGSITLARNGFTSAALRGLQKQILEKSIEAIAEVPIEKRAHSSMTMAIRTSKLPLAKELIKKFRRELCEVLKGEEGPHDSVYNLAISLYPLTRD